MCQEALDITDPTRKNFLSRLLSCGFRGTEIDSGGFTFSFKHILCPDHFSEDFHLCSVQFEQSELKQTEGESTVNKYTVKNTTICIVNIINFFSALFII